MSRGTASPSIPPTGAFGSRLLSAIASAKPPRDPSPLYLLSLIVTACVMVMIPVIYALIVLCVTALVTSWVVVGLYVAFNILSSVGRSGRAGVLLAIIVYVGPLFCGVIVVICMVKSLFAPPPKQEPRPSLTEADEPLLFAAINALADAIGAPRPRAVELDCSVNAAAGFRRGLRSVLSTGDVTLVIGMPLVKTMSVSQFLGVIAHEFGHFAQGGGMRATFIIRSVNHWVARAVYERDAVDVWLDAQAQHSDGWLKIGMMFAQLCVWMTRRVLWVLMMAGHLVSMFMSRQMEFDADRYEGYFVGSEGFARSSVRFELLNICHATAMSTLAESADAGRLIDDVPAFVAWRETQFPDKLRKEIEAEIGQRWTGLFDSHPSTLARIKAIEAHGFVGVLKFDEPAMALFRKADFLCAAATRTWYRDALGDRLDKIKVVPTEEFIGKDKSAKRRADAIRRFLGTEPWTARPLPLDGGEDFTPADARAAGAAILESRKTIGAFAARANAVYDRLNTWQKRTMDYFAATAAREATLSAGLGSDWPSVGSVEAGFKEIRNRNEEEKRIIAEVADFELAAKRRVFSCHWLLAQPTMVKRLPDAPALRERAETLLAVVQALSDVRAANDRLAEHLAEFVGICKCLGRFDGENQKARDAFKRVERDMRRAVLDTENVLRGVDFPYAEKDDERLTVMHAVSAGGAPSNTDDPFKLAELAAKIMERVADLHAQVISELVEIVEKGESAVGFKPLFPDTGATGEPTTPVAASPATAGVAPPQGDRASAGASGSQPLSSATLASAAAAQARSGANHGESHPIPVRMGTLVAAPTPAAASAPPSGSRKPKPSGKAAPANALDAYELNDGQ